MANYAAAMAGSLAKLTLDFISQFRLDFGILGISGIDSDGSLLEFDYHEVRTKRAIIENSRHVMLVVDHSKFGRNAMVNMGSISMVDAVYTDAPPPVKRNAGADGPSYSTGAVLILHGFPRQTKTRRYLRSRSASLTLALPLARNIKSRRPAAESDFARRQRAITCSSCSLSKGRCFLPLRPATP